MFEREGNDKETAKKQWNKWHKLQLNVSLSQ
jgi:hypothetical protein